MKILATSLMLALAAALSACSDSNNPAPSAGASPTPSGSPGATWTRATLQAGCGAVTPGTCTNHVLVVMPDGTFTLDGRSGSLSGAESDRIDNAANAFVALGAQVGPPTCPPHQPMTGAAPGTVNLTISGSDQLVYSTDGTGGYCYQGNLDVARELASALQDALSNHEPAPTPSPSPTP